MITVVVVFALVYLGMALGSMPLLQVDRTGIAVLGLIALVVTKSVTMDEAVRAIHMPTLILLFSFMVIAARVRLGGFYDWITIRLGAFRISAPALLAALIGLAGALAAAFSNHVVCLSIAPVPIDVCAHRRLDPLPFLLAQVMELVGLDRSEEESVEALFNRCADDARPLEAIQEADCPATAEPFAGLPRRLEGLRTFGEITAVDFFAGAAQGQAELA